MTATRRPLTPHQREVWGRLQNAARMPSKSIQTWAWVPLARIGSRTALMHLVHKGYAEHQLKYGPKGGRLDEFRPARSG